MRAARRALLLVAIASCSRADDPQTSTTTVAEPTATTRMQQMWRLLAVVAVVSAAVYGVRLIMGSPQDLGVTEWVSFALGTLVALPVALEVMREQWPRLHRDALRDTLVVALLLTAVNAVLFLWPLPAPVATTALAIPVGIVVWSAVRDGLASASARPRVVPAIRRSSQASVDSPRGVWIHLSSTARLTVVTWTPTLSAICCIFKGSMWSGPSSRNLV